MKKVIILILGMLIFFNGCKGNDKKRYPILWNGESIKNFQGKTMSSMLWLRETRIGYEIKDMQVYKRFDGNDFKLLLQCLEGPDKPPSAGVSSFNQILYLSFLDGTSYIIDFKIWDKTVILSNGYSKKLYALLIQKEVASEYDERKDPMANPPDPNITASKMFEE